MTHDNIFHTDRVTKAGQVFAHEWRMRLQNLRLFVLMSVVFLVLGIYGAFLMMPVTSYEVFQLYGGAYVPSLVKVKGWPLLKGLLAFGKDVLEIKGTWKILSLQPSFFTTTFMGPHGKAVAMKSLDVLTHPTVLASVQKIHRIVMSGLLSWGVGFALIWEVLRRKAVRLEKEKTIDGIPLASASSMRRQIERLGASSLTIAPRLPLLKSAESSHIMILGATGAGKTNCINGFLKQVRAQRKRTVILDTNGTYVDRFYDPSRGDLILNPLDSRSVLWDLWADATTPASFDAFAQALVPDPGSSANPVWHKNAREILAVTAQKLQGDPERSFQKLVDYAGWKPVSQVRSFYEGTAVEALMGASGRAEETVHSVRMQMTDSLKRLALLPDPQGQGFSLKEFVQNPQNQGWLFISTTVADRAFLSPLLKFWVALALQATLERTPYNKDPLFFILDELFSLEGGTVPNLKTFLNEARKYEGCAVLGMQDLAGLQELYGHEGLRTILTNCATKVVFAIRDPQSAQYLSQSLGEVEVIEASESLSMGSHHMRDGVNMGLQRRLKPVVSRNDILSLPNLQAFVSMPANLITKVTYPYFK
jgi:type IV conjugative transfer system coupling protein TraD